MKSLHAIAAAVMLMGSAPVAASDKIVVHHDDLNLASEAGSQALERRIERAAEQLCGDIWTVELALARAARKCRAEAVAGATVRAAALVAQRKSTSMVGSGSK